MGDRYTAMPELRCTFGDRSIVPDVAVMAWERVALTDEGEPIAPGMDRLSCDLTDVGYCSSNKKDRSLYWRSIPQPELRINSDRNH